jgi:ryanodine receptor 2
LFGKALPCLSAIGGALSPDYSYTVAVKENQFSKNGGQAEEQPAEQLVDISLKIRAPFAPEIIDTKGITLTKEYEEIIRVYSEHVHDYWSYNKVIECFQLSRYLVRYLNLILTLSQYLLIRVFK